MKAKRFFNPSFEIASRGVGAGHRPYVIAEMSGNHNGDIERAFAILEAAKKSGADAVKLQTYRPDTITIDHDGPEFRIEGGLWDGRRLFDLYEEAHTPWDWHGPIFDRARAIGLTVFSSVFDETSIEFLESLGAPAYKIASAEIVDHALIRAAAATGKPLIISTGASSLAEIEEAVDVAASDGCRDLALLHCTAAYPAPIAEANLVTIPELARRFCSVVGLSDHTMGTFVPGLAIATGAKIIEKHVTLSRAEGGVDSAFSLEPDELGELCRSVAQAHEALGFPALQPTPSEGLVTKNRRSLYVVAPVRAGEVLTSANVRSVRPANGLAPKFLSSVLGRRATRDLCFGDALSADMVEGLIS
jgi:pseudaminic acid synthase